MAQPHSFREIISYFKNKQLVTIFIFGIASGFPWVMTGSAMSGWLKDEGLSRSSIGLFGLIFAAYSINFLWSPLTDRIKIWYLNSALGQRRSWIFSTQVVIIAATIALSYLNVQQQLSTMALFALFITIAGATQDIAIDAYRIDSLSNKDSNVMAAGSAMATAGWWTGFAGLGSVPFILVDSPDWAWPDVYWVLAFIMTALVFNTLISREPESNGRDQIIHGIQEKYQQLMPSQGIRPYGVLFILPLIFLCIIYANIGYPYWPTQLIANDNQFSAVTLTIVMLLALFYQQLRAMNKDLALRFATNPKSVIQSTPSTIHRLAAWLIATSVAPIQEFFDRNGFKLAISILLFVFLFKIGEAYLGRMSIVFYREVGFSNEDIAYFSKLIHWATTIVFSLIGSVFTIRYGILKGLFIGGIAMSASNLLFAAMAVVGPNKMLFGFTVFVDGFTSAWGSVAFVALLSVLCNKTFTASQYALMASLGTFGRVMVGSYSGIVVDWLDGNWALFFIMTSLMVIPSLCFLYSIRKPLTQLIDKHDQELKASK